MNPSEAQAIDAQTLREMDRAHWLHPLHDAQAQREARLWVSGQGSEITDDQGRVYLDGLAGLWNVNVGHGRKELARAAAEQMETLAYCSSYAGAANKPAILLAERLAQCTPPGITAFFFTSGGSESTESAIKTARYYWKALGKPNKTRVISRDLGYHGVTLAAMSATGIQEYWPMFEPRVPGFSHIPSPYPLYFAHAFQASAEAPTPGIAAANLLQAEIQRLGAENVAAFIAEPVQGAGGVIVPPPDYFPRIREICERYEVLWIADEVITGFGRTGKWFGVEHYGVVPDILNFAKGITSGYVPLGGIGVNAAIREVVADADAQRRWMHAYTYSGHPVACRVALANLDCIEAEHLVDRAAENGAVLLQGLQALQAEHAGVGEARGLGLMAAIELLEDRAERKRFPPERRLGERLRAELVQRGLWNRFRQDVCMLAPPLCTTREQIQRMVQIIDESLHALGI